jgi:selenocysteine-specific elongation factor
LPQTLVDAVFDALQQQGRVRAGSQGQMLFVDRLRPLPAAQQALLDRVVALCEQQRFRPPDRTEIEAHVGTAGDTLTGLLERGVDEARIERVGDHFYGADALRAALQAIRGNCVRNAEVLDIPALRDELDTSRKFLIPLLEHVDALGLTVLRGGVRRLLASSPLNRELQQDA